MPEKASRMEQIQKITLVLCIVGFSGVNSMAIRKPVGNRQQQLPDRRRPLLFLMSGSRLRCEAQQAVDNQLQRASIVGTDQKK
ncbi:MAG: hypothetical protein ABW096_06645 [Candidatus Thiodiazotropha sp.]